MNVDMDLMPFSLINPCGYEGLEVTQISDFDSNVTLEHVESVAIKEMQRLFSKLSQHKRSSIETASKLLKMVKKLTSIHRFQIRRNLIGLG